MRRASALAATAIALALVPTGTAHADAPGPTDYRSEITSISSADGQPLPEVFEVTVEGHDSFLLPIDRYIEVFATYLAHIHDEVTA